jgi:hypothetical protein
MEKTCCTSPAQVRRSQRIPHTRANHTPRLRAQQDSKRVVVASHGGAFSFLDGNPSVVVYVLDRETRRLNAL